MEMKRASGADGLRRPRPRAISIIVDPKRPANRPLVIAIIICGVLIALGLAAGLALGSRDDGSNSGAICESVSDSNAEAAVEYLSATGEYRYASVSTDTELCSRIGTDIMARDRGNAFDAAVAVMFCVGVVNPQSCGLGGGSFFVFYDKKNDEWHSINSREKAPGRATQDMFAEDLDLSLTGGLAAGVPGEVHGLWMLHDRMGSLPWAELLQPTIDLCNDGIPMSSDLYRVIGSKLTTDSLNETFSEYFDEDGNIKPEGSLIQQPELAALLERIQQDPLSFYSGDLAQEIVDDIQDAGGIFELDDLATYEAKWNDTVSLDLPDGYVVHSLDAPASGPVLLYMLNILADYRMNPSMVASTEDEILTYHRIVEAFKFGFGKRTELGDSDFVNVTQSVADMTDPAFGEQTRELIDDVRTQDVAYYYPSGAVLEDSGTSHMSVVDGEGNIVAVTSTINSYFGSTVKGARTGIIFNNQMNNFAVPNTTNTYGVPAAEANFIEPGKRPMSSMCPAVVWDSFTNTPKLVTGASGGTKITTAVALNIIDVLWLGRNLAESIDRPRPHHQLEPDQLELEEGFPEEIAAGLREKGHVTIPADSYAVVQAIRVVEDKLEAVADYRKGGLPDGF